MENALVEAKTFHTRTELGILFIAAHLLSLTSDMLSGEVNSVDIGSQTLSAAVSQAENGREAFFTRTSYGQKYLAMRKASRAGRMFVA